MKIIRDKKYYAYMEYIGEFYLTGEEVEACSHSGSCDDDCEFYLKEGTLHQQLSKFSDKDLLNAVNNYGCELADDTDRDTLEQYILWIAANDIAEEEFMK